MAMQDSFLLDEVRCGFLVPAAMKQAWAAQLEVLSEIDRVCKLHNIQYFADWGTLLGAVRHGGYIPWDDDLDIVMKREDYTKFMTVARLDMAEGFDVQTFRNQEDCWLFMGKVVGRNRFYFEKEHLRKFHNFPYIASIDIFVLDYMYRDEEKEKKRRELCKYMLGVADGIIEGRFSAGEREHGLKTAEGMYGKSLRRIADPVEMGRYLYGEVEKIFARVPEEEADYLTQLFPWGLRGDGFWFPKDYYKQSVYLPFEFTSIPVPYMYDKMLRLRYGDYMHLVKNGAAHEYPFFEGQKKNLQEVLDFELPEFRFDASKLYRSKEDKAYGERSYKAMAKECMAELLGMQEELFEIIKEYLQKKDEALRESAMDRLPGIQQLAIDLGNMLEQMLGEGLSIIALLEKYCEDLYLLYEQLSQEMAVTLRTSLQMSLQAVAEELEQNILSRKTVLFLPVLESDWGSLEGLWQKAVDDPMCDVYVVPLPYYYKDYDGSPRKVCYEAEAFEQALQVADYQVLTPEYLEFLHPEVILIQNPYDSWNAAVSVPEQFYSENLRKYTDSLVYVPPFAVDDYDQRNEREYLNMKSYVPMPGAVYADKILLKSEKLRQMYVKKLTEFAGEETRTIWESKVTVADEILCHDNRREKPLQNVAGRKHILYGISLGAYVGDPAAARAKIKRSLALLLDSGFDVTMQVFPEGAVSVVIRGEIKELSGRQENVSFSENAECEITKYDAYYGDAMPLVLKFSRSGIPAMVQDINL